VTQQEFLQDAMQRLGMTCDEFSERIGTKRQTLDKWLLSENSHSNHEMPDMVWKLIREILAQDKNAI